MCMRQKFYLCININYLLALFVNAYVTHMCFYCNNIMYEYRIFFNEYRCCCCRLRSSLASLLHSSRYNSLYLSASMGRANGWSGQAMVAWHTLKFGLSTCTLGSIQVQKRRTRRAAEENAMCQRLELVQEDKGEESIHSEKRLTR